MNNFDVCKHLTIFALIILSIPTISNCQDKSQSLYNIKVVKVNTVDPFIRGRIVDKETGEPLKGAEVVLEEKMVVKADTSGYFCQQVKPGLYAVKAWAFPYHSVTTISLNIQRGDELTVDFYLAEDKTPLHD